jgi:chromosome segregation ATPase
VTARGGVSARGSVRRGMGPDSPDRLGAIEFNLTELEQEFRERVNELEQEVRKVEQRLNVTRSTIEQRERERDEDRRAELRSSLAWEAWAVLFFVVGTVLSIAGSVGTC